MKQLLILSGKGGTGKTTVAGALIKLSQARICRLRRRCAESALKHDADSRSGTKRLLRHAKNAQIDAEACIGCGQCKRKLPV